MLHLFLIRNLTVSQYVTHKLDFETWKCEFWILNLDIISQFVEFLAMRCGFNLPVWSDRQGVNAEIFRWKWKLWNSIRVLNDTRVQFEVFIHIRYISRSFLSTSYRNCLPFDSQQLIWTETNWRKKTFHGKYWSCCMLSFLCLIALSIFSRNHYLNILISYLHFTLLQQIM